MKKLVALLCLLPLLTVASPAFADWFLSSETKALIAKAEAGDVDAQFRVGGAYDTGNGAPHDTKQALKWYLMAADRGHAEAQNSAASLYQEARNYGEALRWYEKAAAQKHAQATDSVAYMYDLGLGVQQDRQKAFEIYTRSADLGWAEAMWNIANMYGAGQLGERDMVKACAWAMRADKYATSRDVQLRAFLQRVLPQLQSKLSDEQSTSCREQAEAWKPAAPQNRDQPAGLQSASQP